jgi:hypothetical protein
MRSIKKRHRKFTPRSWRWSSLRNIQPHKIKIGGVEHTFDGYFFKVNNEIVNVERNKGYHEIGDIFTILSIVDGTREHKNYMGYCKEKNYYRTFDEDIIEFI